MRSLPAGIVVWSSFDFSQEKDRINYDKSDGYGGLEHELAQASAEDFRYVQEHEGVVKNHENDSKYDNL
jgi:hypothetical protein